MLLDAAAVALDVSGVEPLRVVAGQKLIGKGTMVDGTTVAVKVVVVAGGTTDDQLERARREVELLKDIDHPNVVRVLSDMVEVTEGSERAVAWCEEFIDGDTLLPLLSAEWTEPQIVEVMRQVGSGVAELHRRRVVHRDLSPRNVMVSGSTYKIIDPGYARFLDEATITRHQPGTPGYMSPEHASDATRPNASSDVFTIGIIGYQCATNVLPIPFTGNLARYIHQLRNLTIPPLVGSGAVSDGLGEIIDRCLHPQPARRYIDGAELASHLEGR